MSLTKRIRGALPAFVKRWLGIPLYERIGDVPPLPSRPEGSPMFWSVGDFYAADWVEKLDKAEKELL